LRIKKILSNPSKAKNSLSSSRRTSLGRFPTQRAKPDCFGFRGGPRGRRLSGSETLGEASSENMVGETFGRDDGVAYTGYGEVD